MTRNSKIRTIVALIGLAIFTNAPGYADDAAGLRRAISDLTGENKHADMAKMTNSFIFRTASA